MKRNQSSSARGAKRFRTARRSVVLRAAQSQTAGFNEALAELCNLYWCPLYAFVRQRGYSPEDAQDLTQGFFAHLHRLRKQYSALVREEISHTVSDAGDVGAETHELCEALIAAEGWVMP